ncbi:MAG: BtpA/SgcQ family protein [Candidatus Eremiobacteraeota bacterium]|nr:BtpA/SgcQ family protein [Candidatus Eremiobacteraeota bacterium]
MGRDTVLKDSKAIIGMIHLDALPGTPPAQASLGEVLKKALEEASIYRESGIDMLALENMHDVPYLKGGVGPEIVAAMAVIAYEVRKSTGLPCGIQILAAANREALACAMAAELDFIRAEGFVFAHVADEGIIDGCAGDLLRYRRQIGASKVLVLTDIKKKHSSHALTSDVDIAETARAAQFQLSDGLIVTGVSTGAETDMEELAAVKDAVTIPVLVGSGITLENMERYLGRADALIVGSYFKYDGLWRNGVDPGRVKAFMKKARAIRKWLGAKA